MTSAEATLRDQRDSYLPENFLDPLLDPVRTEPGYRRNLDGLGLTP